MSHAPPIEAILEPIYALVLSLIIEQIIDTEASNTVKSQI